MIIVSDTSPINNLAAINHLHLLQQLYREVLIPEAVYQELTDPDFPVAGTEEVQTFTWIQTRAVQDRTMVKALSSEWVAEPLYKSVLQLVDENDLI
ncbi:hypothetical protein VB711_17605 [Cronbergia sp. UHCC 0137]|uniref:hypothetical protein n=1 Tax=Cronbergia sp. UHCC 0137 TaxID=3110239 RepID=UPI002B1F84CF|nr:hypothetical protein [Cronbergia sp. UHCC 0137]MEA5619643.1 hypothetical protein [Cronbergia sp. UHCC 0137]